MIRFTREQIDEQRKKFQDSGRSQGVANFGGELIDYFLLPAEWGRGKGLTNFLFRMTGEPDAGYIVGVSDNVPEQIRDAYVFSEWAEFMRYGLEDRDKALHAEQEVVSNLSGEVQSEYRINKARMYFEILAGVRRDGLKEWGFNISDVKGFIRAKSFLENLGRNKQ